MEFRETSLGSAGLNLYFLNFLSPFLRNGSASTGGDISPSLNVDSSSSGGGSSTASSSGRSSSLNRHSAYGNSVLNNNNNNLNHGGRPDFTPLTPVSRIQIGGSNGADRPLDRPTLVRPTRTSLQVSTETSLASALQKRGPLIITRILKFRIFTDQSSSFLFFLAR